MSEEMIKVMGVVLGLLVAASIAGWWMKRRATTEDGKRTVDNFNARTKSWWVMVAIFVVTLCLGG